MFQPGYRGTLIGSVWGRSSLTRVQRGE